MNKPEFVKQLRAIAEELKSLTESTTSIGKRFSLGGLGSARLFTVVWVFFLAIPSFAQKPPDTIYYNGVIVTMWAAHPVVEAVAIRGDRFTSAGSNDEILRTAGPATVKINLHGRCVMPGLIDSHCHPIMAALEERDSQAPPLHSIADIQAYIQHRARILSPRQTILVPHVFVTRLK